MRQFLLIAVCLVAADAPDPATDGKSLAGWEGTMSHWKVADGAIVGTTDGALNNNTFLCSDEGTKYVL